MKTIFSVAFIFLLASPVVVAQTKAGKVDTTKHATYYTCPMHPDVISKKTGKCPQCGMELKRSNKEQMKAGVTKNYVCPVHVDVVTHNPGKCPKCGEKLNLSSKEQMKAETMKIYTCPMHPEIALDKEGKCPKCGKSLVEKKDNKTKRT